MTIIIKGKIVHLTLTDSSGNEVVIQGDDAGMICGGCGSVVLDFATHNCKPKPTETKLLPQPKENNQL